jgi:hypothetical protein
MKYKVFKIFPNGDLWCESETGQRLTIDVHTDRGYNDKEAPPLNVGDTFECEIFPYIPLYFANYSTIRKVTT